MTLPNFLIIGAAKSGTTALTRFLQQHPQVHIPYKEPNFFSGWNTRIPFYIPPRPKHEIPPHQCATLEEYQALFAQAGNALAIGEASVSYLPDAATPRAIHALLPDVKLIVLLRQPIERAYSQFHMSRHALIEPETDFVQAIRNEPERIRANWLPFLCYLKLGHYPEQLARYQALFAPEQMRIYLHDDLSKNPQPIWHDVLNFLELRRDFSPDFSQRHNENRTATSVWSFVQSLSPQVKRLFPTQFRPVLYQWLHRKLTHRPLQLNPTLRSELTEIHFKQDILRLQEDLQRDLSHWF